MISAWLTCLEALGLKKERDDLIEEAREYMLANANFIAQEFMGFYNLVSRI